MTAAIQQIRTLRNDPNYQPTDIEITHQMQQIQRFADEELARQKYCPIM
jgi:hypothetical protein